MPLFFKKCLKQFFQDSSRQKQKPPVHRGCFPRGRRARAATQDTGGSLERNLRLGGLQAILREAPEPALLLEGLQRQRPKGPEPTGQTPAAALGVRAAPDPGVESGSRRVSSSPDFTISSIGATAAMARSSGQLTSGRSSAPNPAATPSGRGAGDSCTVTPRWRVAGIVKGTTSLRRTFPMVMP